MSKTEEFFNTEADKLNAALDALGLTAEQKRGVIGVVANQLNPSKQGLGVLSVLALDLTKA